MTIGRRPGLRAVLASSGYRCLLAAQTVSRRGDTASAVALVVLVFQLTGSWLKVTGAVIAEVLPVLLLGPVAGAVADRLPRIRVMVLADLWRMGLAALLPLASHHLAAVYAGRVRPVGRDGVLQPGGRPRADYPGTRSPDPEAAPLGTVAGVTRAKPAPPPVGLPAEEPGG